MTWILGIDTSRRVAVSLARSGESVVPEVVTDTHVHDEVLTSPIQRPCTSIEIAMTGIDTYAVGMGPGPLTGPCVRVVTAHTLAAVTGKPLRGMCSLDMIVVQWQNAPDESVATSGARRREFYWALHRDGTHVGEPRVNAPGAIPDLSATGPTLDGPTGPCHLDAAMLTAR